MNALRSELSWTHYRSLMRFEDKVAREFYLEEASKCGWSSRQLDRQINSFYYQRILASAVVFVIENMRSKSALVQTEPRRFFILMLQGLRIQVMIITA